MKSGISFGRLLMLLVLVISSALSSQPVVAQDGASNPIIERAGNTVEIARKLGIPIPDVTDRTAFSLEVAELASAELLPLEPQAIDAPDANIPLNLLGNAAFSAAVMTNLGGPAGDLAEIDILGDFDGREDLFADHGIKVDDLSMRIPVTGAWMLTRSAFSAHTIANGFTENIFYYGDSVGNLYVAVTGVYGSYGTLVDPATVSTKVLVLNLPTILNAFGTLSSDSQIIITGIVVNPVADLSSFPNVNGSFAPFAGQIGEVVYVSFWDPAGGLRLAANNTLVSSGLLAFPVADLPSPAKAAPGVQSDLGFPVMVGGAFGVVFSVFENVAGIAVDDDGSVYFQQADLVNLTGANIVKITDVGSNLDRSLAVSGILTLTTLNPVDGIYGVTSGPMSQVNWVTNYTGTSPVFGNISAIAGGPHNTLYAAVARSLDPAADAQTQDSSGLFANPEALGVTSSMIISFADVAGALDPCSSYPYTYSVIDPGPITRTLSYAGVLPIGDNFADSVAAGTDISAGINNYQVFALGAGPDVGAGLAELGLANADVPQVDFQVDFGLFAGLAVDEDYSVYVVSGGTPAYVGRNPSPGRGEILLFPDRSRYDRQADYVDLRGDVMPVLAVSSDLVGDGDSDRYDHIFYTAPLDPLTFQPAGITGLSRGFLAYLNRTRNDVTRFLGLPNGSPQLDDATSGLVSFYEFDPSHQVDGGDDFSYPYLGDEGPFPTNYGFEFEASSTGASADFYLNSNGSVSFGAGDAAAVSDAAAFLAGPPRVAGAWADLNPEGRTVDSHSFPVQALGFSGINSFKVRWINVPLAGEEVCGSRNSFSATLFDDGTGIKEGVGSLEGPTDLRYAPEAVLAPWRYEGSTWVYLDYGRMDLRGTDVNPVIVGYTSSNGAPGDESFNLSIKAYGAFQSSSLYPSFLTQRGSSTYEVFNTGSEAELLNPGLDQYFFPAEPTFDLRFTGNDPLAATGATQAETSWDVLSFYIYNFVFAPLITR